MSTAEYRGNFLRIRNNLTEWLENAVGKVYLISDEKINVSELEKLRSVLNDETVIAVAADNKYALSGFAGAHYFGNGNTQETRRQFTKESLIEMAIKAGFDIADIHMYYPYPDMSLPLAIYSDRYLPRKGELTNNYRNFGTDRLYIFDEAAKWDEIIEDGRFPDFANSFLMVLTSHAKPQNNKLWISAGKEFPVFIKYSNDRADKYRICTQIYYNAVEEYVVKSPMTEAAKEHVANLVSSRKKLMERYAGFAGKHGVNIRVNCCAPDGDRVIFEYLDQESLESRLLSLMASGKRRELFKYISTFCDMVRYNSDYGVWDIDLIFKNIFVNERGNEWTIIDHEWTWDVTQGNAAEIADYIIQRAVYYFIADNPKAGLESLDLFAFTKTKEPHLPHKCYEEDNAFEKAFQKQVTGEHCTLGAIYGKTHGRIYDVGRLVSEEQKREYRNSVSTKEAAFTDNHAGESHELVIDIHGKDKVTVYPAHCCCFVYLRSTSVKCKISTNGTKITKRLYAFTNTTPEMTFELADNTAAKTDKFKVDLYVSSQGSNDSPVFEAVIKALSWKRLLM